MTELTVGDFLYQSDQELFLVVTGETEDSYNFAVHGWRSIGKDRIDEYISNSRSKIHRQEEIEQIVSEEGNNIENEFNRLKQLFSVYETSNLPDDWMNQNFVFKKE